MEVVVVAQRIEKLISEIGKTRRQIEEKGRNRAAAITDYDKRIEIAIVTLREQGKFPATLIEKIAKGVCSPERYAMEVAESDYRACVSNLEALKAQLNGYQSIYRHLDVT